MKKGFEKLETQGLVADLRLTVSGQDKIAHGSSERTEVSTHVSVSVSVSVFDFFLAMTSYDNKLVLSLCPSFSASARNCHRRDQARSCVVL